MFVLYPKSYSQWNPVVYGAHWALVRTMVYIPQGAGNNRCTIDGCMEERCDRYGTRTYMSPMNHVIVLKTKVSEHEWDWVVGTGRGLISRLGSLSTDGPRHFRQQPGFPLTWVYTRSWVKLNSYVKPLNASGYSATKAANRSPNFLMSGV